MIDCLAGKIRVSELELVPTQHLSFRQSRDRPDWPVGHGWHVVRGGVLENVPDFLSRVDRDGFFGGHGLDKVSVVVVEMCNEDSLESVEHSAALHSLYPAHHFLTSAIDQERSLGIRHEQARGAGLVPPTRRRLAEFRRHWHPIDLFGPEDSVGSSM